MVAAFKNTPGEGRGRGYICAAAFFCLVAKSAKTVLYGVGRASGNAAAARVFALLAEVLGPNRGVEIQDTVPKQGLIRRHSQSERRPRGS